MPLQNQSLWRRLNTVVLWGCVMAITISGVLQLPENANATASVEEGLDMNFLAHLFVRAEEATDLNRYLLAAIAAQESSFHPWTINLNGQGCYPASKHDALAQIGNYRNFDLGLMQINSFWLPKFGVSAEDALDPAMNVVLGSVILLDCIERYGIWGGIACYHAGNPHKEHGKKYAEKVVAKWKSLENTSPGPEPESE